MKYSSATHNVQENGNLKRPFCFIFIKNVQPGMLTCPTSQYGRVCGYVDTPAGYEEAAGDCQQNQRGDLVRLDSPEKYGLFQQFVQCMLYLYPL